MRKATLTLKFKGMEAELLEKMVSLGFFNSRSEAIRAVIVKYAVDNGLLSRETLWRRMEAHKKRGVTPEQLKKNLQCL